MAVQAPPDLQEQYRALRQRAGVVDRSDRGKLDLTGPEALEYLQGQVTNDIESLEPGRGCYAAMLNPKGRILADVRVLARTPEELRLDTEAAALEHALRELRTYKIGRRVEIHDLTAERAILSVIGPAAGTLVRQALQSLGVAGLPEPPHEEHSFVEAQLDGEALLAIATDVGVDMMFDRQRLQAVRDVVLAAGAVEVTPQVAEVVRIETGRPRYGLDMSSENLPAEVGIVERAVSFTKGCYVGQEPVARMHYKGHPNRHLRGLMLSEPVPPQAPLLAGEREVGRVTSAAISPALGSIALGLVRREVELGDELHVGVDGARATVVPLPFEPR